MVRAVGAAEAACKVSNSSSKAGEGAEDVSVFRSDIATFKLKMDLAGWIETAFDLLWGAL